MKKSYFEKYIALSSSADIGISIKNSYHNLMEVLDSLSEEEMCFKYEEGKWSIKDLVQHISDTERIFVYRALRFARNDKAELAGYNENEFASEAFADEKTKEQLMEEYNSVHQATLLFFRNIPEKYRSRKGIASGVEFTVNEIAHLLAGHSQHHLSVLKDRYLSKLNK